MPVTRDGFAGRRLTQRALDQQVPAFGEPQRAEVYAHALVHTCHERLDRSESRDRRRERRIAAHSAGNPLLQSFEIEQRAYLGIAVRHAQQQIAKLRDLALAERRRAP